MLQASLNQPLSLSFTSSGLVTGKTSFTTKLVRDGVLVTPTVSYSEIGSGLYTYTFTPTSTGRYTLFIEGLIQANFEVVSRTVYQMLQNLEDESLGSWSWNKTTGVLSLVRQDGSLLATFNVTDTPDSASKERV